MQENKIAIKNLWGLWRTSFLDAPKKSVYDQWSENIDGVQVYDWERLGRDLMKNGLTDPIQVQAYTIGKLRVQGVYWKHLTQYTHRVMDGNHRVALLNKLYGEEHLVNVILHIPNEEH